MDSYPIDYEQIVQEVYEALLREGDVAIDVGAHVGRHTLPLACCVAPTGRVFAFEPLPMCREMLAAELTERHSELADIIKLCPQALADSAGDRPFVVAEDALPFSGLYEVIYPNATRLRRLTVPVETIDRLFRGLPSLRCIKIDAEGAELAILRGATAVLDRLRPVVSFEFGTSANAQHGITPADMARFWEERGYHIYGIHGRQLTEADFVESARRHEIWDYVAVPRENAAAEKAVCQTLRRPRVNWLAVGDHVRQAERHADVGAAVPRLRRFRGPVRSLARGVARLVLLVAQIVTRPQREVNLCLVRSLTWLADGLQKADKEQGRRATRLRELEEKVASLEQQLARLGEIHRQTLDLLEERLAQRETARIGE
jgi:FkbM family methyltransferase